jgi:hypothetical protein
MDWEIIRAIPKWALDHVASSPFIVGIALLAGLLLWRRNFQIKGIDLWEARRKRKAAEREDRLADLAIRMDAVKESVKREYKIINLVMNEEAYSERLKLDDPEDIREILRRRSRRA